jgi:cell division septation protein DedD
MEFAMISFVLALHAAAFSMQSDTTRSSREAFTACLRRFVDSSLEANKTREEFTSLFPQACTPEQNAFRAAIIARDTANRSTRANAEDAANLEVEDARVNFNDRFEMSMPPPQQAAAAAPAATPAAQPVAQTAAQTTPTPAPQPASQPH